MSLYENMIQVPVRMGSHRFGVNASVESGLRSGELIAHVIEKCRLSGGDRLAKTYAVYESSNGIERRLKTSDDLAKLLLAQQHSTQIFEFVVRKVTRVERRVARSHATVPRVTTEKCFRQLRKMQQLEDTAAKSSPSRTLQVYEDVDRDERLRSQIADNERVLEQQTRRLAALDTSILKLTSSSSSSSASSVAQDDDRDDDSSLDGCEPAARTKTCCHNNNNNNKLRENIGVLKMLYAKLRAVQMRRIYESSEAMSNKSMTSTSSRLCLIDDSGVNSCGSSCSGGDLEDDVCLELSSTSTLESLV